MALALKRPARYNPRRPRAGVSFEGHLLLPDDRLVPITIQNISSDGCMGACTVPVAEGSWIGIDLPGYGIVHALVRWCEHGELGCRFRRSIDFARLGIPNLT